MSVILKAYGSFFLLVSINFLVASYLNDKIRYANGEKLIGRNALIKRRILSYKLN